MQAALRTVPEHRYCTEIPNQAYRQRILKSQAVIIAYPAVIPFGKYVDAFSECRFHPNDGKFPLDLSEVRFQHGQELEVPAFRAWLNLPALAVGIQISGVDLGRDRQADHLACPPPKTYTRAEARVL